MLMSTLSDSEREMREQMINFLVSDGWTPTEEHVYFENGNESDYSVSLTYTNDTAELLLELYAEDSSVEFRVRVGGKELPLIIHPESKLMSLLERINSARDLISKNNFRDTVREILEICPVVYIDKEDGEPVRLYAESEIE